MICAQKKNNRMNIATKTNYIRSYSTMSNTTHRARGSYIAGSQLLMIMFYACIEPNLSVCAGNVARTIYIATTEYLAIVTLKEFFCFYLQMQKCQQLHQETVH